MPADVFANLKPLVKPAKSKAAKLENKTEIEGLEDMALLDNLIKALTSVRKTMESDVKAKAREIFVAQADNLHRRPDNLKAFEGDADASIELRKRSTASPLSDDECAALREHDIPFETIEETPELIAINPEIAADQAKLQIISKALQGVKLPLNLFIRQERVTKDVVVDATVEAVFKNGLGDELLETVALIAAKPKIADTDTNIKLALERVQKLFGKQKDKDHNDLKANLKASGKGK